MERSVLLVLVCVLTWRRCHSLFNCSTTFTDLFPEWDPAPYSCLGRCGEEFTVQACACDRLCPLYGDCCQDMENHCAKNDMENLTSATSSDFSSSSFSNGTALENFNTTAVDGLELQISANTRDGSSADHVYSRSRVGPEMVKCDLGRARLVSACPVPMMGPEGPVLYGGRWIQGRELKEKCQMPRKMSLQPDALQFLPVTDAVSGLHFLNVYCMLCHGGHVPHALPWSLAFVWSAKLQQNPLNLEDLLVLAGQKKLLTTAFPPEDVSARRCLLPATVDQAPCRCPHLVQKCLADPDAYIMGNSALYRNPHCLLCTFISVGRGPTIVQQADVDDLVSVQNSFEFFVKLDWASPPAENAVASLNISHKMGPHFSWRSMQCTMEAQGDRESQSQPDGRSSATDINEDKKEEEREKESTNSQGGVRSGQLEQEDPVTKNRASRSDGEEVTHRTDSRVTCRHTLCSTGFGLAFMADGVCRLDMDLLLLNVLVTCVQPQPVSPASLFMLSINGPKNHLLFDNTQISLTSDLQTRLNATFEDAFVLKLSISRGLNHCFWNISTYTVFGKGVARREENFQKRLASSMYDATYAALEQEIANTTLPLSICVRVQSVFISANLAEEEEEKEEEEEEKQEEEDACALSTTIWPDATGGGTSAARPEVLLQSLAVVVIVIVLVF